MATKTSVLLKFIQDKGLVRVRDVAEMGIPPVYFQRLYRRGLIMRVSRGTYRASYGTPDLYFTMAVASKRAPHSVVCLLSALQYHGLTTQLPSELWMAIDRKAGKPRIPDLPLHFVRWSASLLMVGIKTYVYEGVDVRITDPARTVVDCFKYRHKIGLEIALAALKEVLHKEACSVEALMYFADLCRVRHVMTPYMEAFLLHT